MKRGSPYKKKERRKKNDKACGSANVNRTTLNITKSTKIIPIK